MNSTLPQDPAILLSYINTQLRDYYPNLNELCKSLNLDEEEIQQKLQAIDYLYNPESNKFE